MFFTGNIRVLMDRQRICLASIHSVRILSNVSYRGYSSNFDTHRNCIELQYESNTIHVHVCYILALPSVYVEYVHVRATWVCTYVHI